MHKQQQETLTYFNASAEEWRLKAEGAFKRVNMIAQRNGAVLRVRDKLGSGIRALDLGCGTGELVLAMAGTGVEAIGIDFAPEMIQACEQKRIADGVEGARFECASISDFKDEGGGFDIISGLGLIEYVSPDELDGVIERSASMLRPGGRLALGSRNRLYNLFSLNDYTLLELNLGVTEPLLREATALATAETMAQAITAAEAVAQKPLPHPEYHPATGIKVSVRYQYTPGELIARCRAKGLTALTIYPVHYHGIPASMKTDAMDTHIQISHLAYETGAEDYRLVPSSSSFVLEAQKA